MSATVHYQQSLDVICQHKPDGSIVPLKLRLRDADGEYQAYMVKSYRCCGLTDEIKNPTYSRVMFECKINSFGRERIIKVSYSYTDGIWRLLEREALFFIV